MRRIPPLEVAAAGAIGLAALLVAARAGVKNVEAVPDVLRSVAATLALIGVGGYGPARLLTGRDLWPHFAVIVLLVGCVTAGLGLTVLGSVGIPFGVSLTLFMVAGLACALAVRTRIGPARPSQEDLAAAGGRRFTQGWPLYLGVILVCCLLTPTFAAGFATVQGTNPDGMLGVGTAELLQHASPTGVDEDLPVDQMPYVWRSKYPIYYVLAGASSLSGLDPTQAFAGLSAVLAALTAAGFMLVARYTLRAGPRAAVLAMAAVGFHGALAYLALHPYHNQLWGTMALGPMLLFGLRWLDRPNRADALLLAGFLVLGLAAYPLMVLFPGLAFAGAAVVARRRGGLRLRRPRIPRSRLARAGVIAGSLVAAPAVLVIAVGVIEKSVTAAGNLLSGETLWNGDLRHYRSPGSFVSVTGHVGDVAAAMLLVAAALGARRLPALQRWAFSAMIAGGLAVGVYFRFRATGEYFYFKVIAFLAPVLIIVAVVWVARRAGSVGLGRVAAAGVAVFVALQLAGLRREVVDTGVQLDAKTLELRDAARKLPDGASVRVDVLPDGRQLWVGYVLSEHPLSGSQPLVGTTYPYLPLGRKADFIVADGRLDVERWPDAQGEPLFDNGSFRIYRMRDGVPGPDHSSKLMRR